MLHNLGNADNYSPEALERIGRQLIELVKGPLPELEPIKELSRHNYGYPLVIGSLLKIYGLDTLLARLKRKHKLSFSLLPPLLLMLSDRFNDPLSKLGSYNLQNEYVGSAAIPLQHLYRTLDYMAENNQLIQTHIYNKHCSLFNYELDVVFYDVTTFYFDSDVVKEGAYRQKGYGKDGKIGKTQVLFSLLIDKNKIPIGFELYKGSQYEGHTFKDAVTKLKSKYNIKRIIVVADSGMLNNDNLDLFDTEQQADGYEYIVGDRLKNLPDSVTDYLCNLKNYTTIRIKEEQQLKEKDSNQSEDANDESIFLKYATYIYNGRTIICTWSAKRAAKDKAERDEKITRAQLLLKKPANLEKKSRKYYIKSDKEKIYKLDTEKIKRDERFDGFKAICTNATDITAQVAIEKYKDLYKIEQSFRTFKSYLETRPMFHWTDTRIEGHLVVCYIAFCLLTYLQSCLGPGYSENDIRRALSKMELSKIQRDQDTSWLRSARTPEEEVIMKSLKIKQLPNVISEIAISNYIPTYM
jgi:transposase